MINSWDHYYHSHFCQSQLIQIESIQLQMTRNKISAAFTILVISWQMIDLYFCDTRCKFTWHRMHINACMHISRGLAQRGCFRLVFSFFLSPFLFFCVLFSCKIHEAKGGVGYKSRIFFRENSWDVSRTPNRMFASRKMQDTLLQQSRINARVRRHADSRMLTRLELGFLLVVGLLFY